MDKLKLNIGGLKEGEYDYEFQVSPDEFELEDVNTAGDIGVSIKLIKSGNQITANVRLDGKYELLCDKCTEKYEHDFKNSFEIIYKYEFRDDADIEEESDEEIKFIHPNTKYIEVKNDIRDFVILSVPMKKAPVEIDGRCSYCGKEMTRVIPDSSGDKGVNPVWEKLIKVKSK